MEGVEMSVKNQLNWAFLLEKKDFFNQLFLLEPKYRDYNEKFKLTKTLNLRDMAFKARQASRRSS